MKGGNLSVQEKMRINQEESITIVATEEVVQKIANLSGDTNPLHLDEEYAKTTVFGKRIVHATFCINGISRLLGTILPGGGTILLSQTFTYLRPVYIGDTIKISATILRREEKDRYVLGILCTNQDDVKVLEGESLVIWKERN